MLYKENTAAFVLGIIAGALNVLFALLTTLGGPITDNTATLIIFIAADLVCLANLTGACICRTHNVAGGVMMLATSLPMLILFIVTIASPVGEALRAFSPVTATVLYIMVIAELASLTAGIICLASGSQNQHAPDCQRFIDEPPIEYEKSEFLRQYGQMSVKTPSESQSYASHYVPEHQASAALKCANCGADIPAGASFCIMCGAKQ